MRDFIDAIFYIVGVASISTEEFETVTVDVPTYTSDLYVELLAVLDSRESVSDAQVRLYHAFLSRGIDVTEPDSGKSNILIGGVLCE